MSHLFFLISKPNSSAPKSPTDFKIKSCYVHFFPPSSLWSQFQLKSKTQAALTTLVQLTLRGRSCLRPFHNFFSPPLNSHDSSSCQLFTLSLWGGSSGFSQERWNCWFASDLLNLLLCARQWQRLPILRVKWGGEKMKKKINKKILVSGDATERLLKGTAQK